MCVAAIGKVKSIQGDLASVDFSGNIVYARTGLVSVREGDEVLVHAGCILQKVSREENSSATDLSDIMKEVGAF